jgi:hypothetical protein
VRDLVERRRMYRWFEVIVRGDVSRTGLSVFALSDSIDNCGSAIDDQSVQLSLSSIPLQGTLNP